jgi:membrane-associated phospholipid phosphatase
MTKLLLFAVALAAAFGQDQPDVSRSAAKDVSGPPATRNKNQWEATGYFRPFSRLPKYILSDQAAIWTSPFHTARSDAKWWGIFGGAAGALIASDKWTVRQLPNTPAQVRLGNYASYAGSAYTLIPLSAGFYFLGTAAGNRRARETGLLAFETYIDATLVEVALKAATRRARPLQGDGNGRFWDGSSGFLNAGFPSGHATSTWALASVFAHQYRDRIYVPIIAYTLAAGVAAARVGARRHFPGDVVAGAAMGWFIGDYVYGKRHNPELGENRGAIRKILTHVRVGATID